MNELIISIKNLKQNNLSTKFVTHESFPDILNLVLDKSIPLPSTILNALVKYI